MRPSRPSWVMLLSGLVCLAMIIATAVLALSGRTAAYTSSIIPPRSPAHVKKVPLVRLVPVRGGGGLLRVVLAPKAVERLAIRTVPVAKETGTRRRTVSGGIALANGALVVEVALAGTTDRPAHGSIAQVRRLASAPGETGEPARLREIAPSSAAGGQPSAIFELSAARPGAFQPGERVWIEMAISEPGRALLTIPYASVLYDAEGRAWAYTNPEPLSYVRTAVTVDYIDGDKAVLSKGPPVGSLVVSVGAVELYGAESKLGL